MQFTFQSGEEFQIGPGDSGSIIESGALVWPSPSRGSEPDWNATMTLYRRVEDSPGGPVATCPSADTGCLCPSHSSLPRSLLPINQSLPLLAGQAQQILFTANKGPKRSQGYSIAPIG